jgi:hypothetical protein
MAISEDWLWFLNSLVFGLPFLAALSWGAAPERICAGAFVFNILADRLYHELVGRSTVYETVDLGHLIIGLVMLAAFFGVAFWANRTYPLWVAALQILVVLSHFAREASAGVGPLAYATLTYGPSILQISIVVLGLSLHHRRVRTTGPYPSWRSSSIFSRKEIRESSRSA